MTSWVPFLFLMEQILTVLNTRAKITFCKQLASWMFASDWHFTTLLSTAIQSVHGLPDDADKVINELLIRYPEKPSVMELSLFLETNAHVHNWFHLVASKPKIKFFNLQLENNSNLKRFQNLPEIESIADLADWLNITLGELEWLADLKRSDIQAEKKLKHYHYSFVEKRRGGILNH